MINKLTDTIVAISTPNGPGAIGIIRLSGDKAFFIAKKISKKNLKPGFIQHAPFFDNKDNLLDLGIILSFKKPKSFTGDDLVEFHAHGSSLILNVLISRIIRLGARLAEPGEFSFRAFLNKKIDLIQAESINLLINSKNYVYNNFILKSLSGYLSNEIKYLLNIFTTLRDQIEAAIEFPDDIQIYINNILTEFEKIKIIFYKLFKKLNLAHFISNKYKIVILGNTNVGKSSLFNFLLNNDRSIISDIPGTTRDFIESDFIINGSDFKLVDTAGFNPDVTSIIEKNGILKAWKQLDDASIIIFMFDIYKISNQFKCEIFNNIFNKYKNTKKFFIIKNKIDLIKSKEKIIFNKNYTEIHVSIKHTLGLDILINEIKKILIEIGEYSYVISKRHYSLFLKIRKILKSINFKNNEHIVWDIYAEKISLICSLLKEILGENVSNDTLDSIFSKFCLGK